MIRRVDIRYWIYGYFFLTVFGFLLWNKMPSTHVISLFGCHTTVYMFLFSLLLMDQGLSILAIVCFALWPMYILALIVCYLIAVFKKKYIPLAIISVIDVAFTIFIALRYVQVGILNEAFICILGAFTSLLTAKALFCHNKQEILHSHTEFETNS